MNILGELQFGPQIISASAASWRGPSAVASRRGPSAAAAAARSPTPSPTIYSSRVFKWPMFFQFNGLEVATGFQISNDYLTLERTSYLGSGYYKGIAITWSTSF